MLSFEISAIDIVLLVAVMVLILLFATKQRGKTVFEPQLPQTSVEEELENPEIGAQPNKKSKEPKEMQASSGNTKCIHHFGYLRNLPQNTPVPDECFGCPKIMRCLFPNPQTQQAE